MDGPTILAIITGVMALLAAGLFVFLLWNGAHLAYEEPVAPPPNIMDRRREEKECPVHGDEYPYGGVCSCWRNGGVVGRSSWNG